MSVSFKYISVCLNIYLDSIKRNWHWKIRGCAICTIRGTKSHIFWWSYPSDFLSILATQLHGLDPPHFVFAPQDGNNGLDYQEFARLWATIKGEEEVRRGITSKSRSRTSMKHEENSRFISINSGPSPSSCGKKTYSFQSIGPLGQCFL